MNIEQIVDIAESQDLQESLGQHIIDHVQCTNEYSSLKDVLLDWFDEQSFDEDTERILALMEHTEEDYTTCESYITKDTWSVLTDEEADDKWNEYLNNYIEECILPDLPETAQIYFDKDSWIKDAKYDGRGHSLSSYDGNEESCTINGTEYYLYRNN